MDVQAQKSVAKKFTYTFENIDQNILLPMKYTKQTLMPCNKIFLGFIDVLKCWISVPEDKLAIIKDMILDLNAYSAIDDIADNTIMRGGIPAAYKIFGTVNTVNSYDFLLWGTLEKVWKLNQPTAVRMYLQSLVGTYAGVSTEVYWRENYICPTEEEYNQNAHLKNTSWMLLLGRLMQLFDSNYKHTDTFIADVSLYFQISDDYNCLTSQKHFESKGIFCEDITEGKFGFPTVHAINSHPEVKETLIDILKQRTTDVAVKKQFLSVLEKCGSFEYTLKKLEGVKLIILEEMEMLGGNPLLEKILEFSTQTN